MNWVLGGWTINGIGTFRSGAPLGGRVGSNASANRLQQQSYVGSLSGLQDWIEGDTRGYAAANSDPMV